MPDHPTSGLAALAEFVQDLTIKSLVAEDHPAGGKYVVVPEGHEVKRLAPAYEKAPFVQANPTFFQVESFTNYVNDYKLGATRIFADMANQQMTAIIDYHGRASEAETGVAEAAHRADLKLRYSPEWEAWHKAHAIPHSQLEFANFIEEYADTILSPPAADLLEMVQNFQDNRTVIFQSKINRANGMVNLTFAEEENAQATGRAKIPERLTLLIPVYEGEESEEVQVFVRTNVERGKLTITPKMHKVEQLKRQAFTRIVQGVDKVTGLTTAFGAPGGPRRY